MVVVADVPDKVERWTSGRRVALVLSILKGEISVQEAARKHALRVAEIEDWKDKFLSGANNALRSRPGNEEQLKDEEIKKLKQKVGELVEGDLVVVANTNVQTLELGALQSIGEHFIVREMDQLQTMNGLGSLRDVGRLTITDNPALLSLVGLSGLERVRGHLRIVGNRSLPQSQIDAFLSRVVVDGDIDIRENASR